MKNKRSNYVETAEKAMRRARREAELARGGRQRAWVAKNGKAVASKQACRKSQISY